LCAVAWDDFDMELEKGRCEFERRLEEGRGDLVKRIEELQRILREGGEERRREWEELNGRLMTADEKRQFENDHIQRVLAQMTDAHGKTVQAAQEDTRRAFDEWRAESRAKFEELQAEARAQRQATLRMLDRLSPPEEEGS
jgi:acyl-CoA reductase-like NAD-dependent aldehyde dehydrogenase